jgi:hypothetical protein
MDFICCCPSSGEAGSGRRRHAAEMLSRCIRCRRRRGFPAQGSWLIGVAENPGSFGARHRSSGLSPQSAYWDKKHGLWRVAEDDPDSDLYAESSDADTVISYIVANA